MRKKSLHHTLEEPHRLDCIPKNSQWLSGEGAGSWFLISAIQDKFSITRYSPKGKIECSGIFEITNNIQFDINAPYKFTHLSHYKSVKIIQYDEVLKMERKISAQV
jgi:hypothetical protein